MAPGNNTMELMGVGKNVVKDWSECHQTFVPT